MDPITRQSRKWFFPFVIASSSLAFVVAGFDNFLLFHTLVELFTVVVAFGIFVLAWSSRRYINNNFLLILGIGYLFIGSFDLLHALSYKGLSIIKNGGNSNLATQLWIAARYLEAFSFLAASLFLGKKHLNGFKNTRQKSEAILFAYSSVYIIFFLSIFYWEIFPDSYIEGIGLTRFKIFGEYFIIGLFLLSAWLFIRKKERFPKETGGLMLLVVATKVISELFFTEYIGVYDFFNVLGHVFKYISFLLIYKAVIETGLMRPYKFLFHGLKESETRYKALFENMIDGFAFYKIISSDGKSMEYVLMETNKAFGGLFGFSREEIIGKKITEIVPEFTEEGKGILQLYERVAKTGDEVCFEYYSELRKRWFYVTVYRPQKGYLATIFSDITPRKHSEERLLQVQQELRERTESQLVESYEHLGRVNRKIALLLDMEKNARNKKNRNSIVDYILDSARKLSHADTAFLFKYQEGGSFKLLSSSWTEKQEKLQLGNIEPKDAKFILEMIENPRRISGPCELVDPGCFSHNGKLSYFVALPMVKNKTLCGFLFLGFFNRNSLDAQEIQFMDVFSTHATSALVTAEIL